MGELQVLQIKFRRIRSFFGGEVQFKLERTIFQQSVRIEEHLRKHLWDPYNGGNT